MGILQALIRRRVMTTVFVLIAVILGALSYVEIGIRRFPDIDFPMASITTTFPGGSPEEVETEITKRLEDAVSSIEGIDEIRSYSQQGVSLIMVQFDLEEDIDIKAMDIRDKIDQVRTNLPTDAEDPIVGKFDFAQTPVVTLALTGPQDVNELYRLADEVLEDRLGQVSGVASVQITGGQRREVHVLLDPARLRKHRVSVEEISAAIAGTNLELPAGHITQPQMEYTLRTTGRFEGVDDILDVPIRHTGNEVLQVRHVARVFDTYEEERSRSRADGQTSVILSVLKQSGANDVEISDGVQAELKRLRELLPEGARLFIAEDTSDYVRGALANVRTNILLGILFTSIVLYLFLGSVRGTIIAAVVMPSALVITFVFLNFSDISVNILTLTALALSMGIVVNNAILVLENTHRLMEGGMEGAEAAVAGTKDIGLAIISSTATNLVVFLPIAFMGEIIGRFFREFGLTIVYVTSVSLLISFSLTPMMCGALLRGETRENNIFTRALHLPHKIWTAGSDWVRDRYLDMLNWCLRWPTTTVLITFVCMVGALAALVLVVGSEFFPEADEGRMNISVETTTGSSLDFTSERVADLEEVIAGNIPERYLRHYYSRVGRVAGFLGSSSSGTNLAEVGISLVDKSMREKNVQQILNDLRPHLAEVHSAKLTASTSQGAGPGGSPLAVEISGPEMEELQQVTGRVLNVVETTRGTSDVDQSYRSGQPEIRLQPNQPRFGRHRLTVRSLAMTVRTFVEGREVSQYRDLGEDYEIRLKLDEPFRRWSEDVGRMFVKSPVTGQMISIEQVAEPLYQSGPTVITRKDRQRLITVNSQLTGERSLGEVKNEVERRIKSEVPTPEGVQIGFGGEVEMMRKNFVELFKAMATAVSLTFLCVAGIIESFLFAIIIVMAVPVSLIGVTLALLIGDVALNIFSLMAMIMLVGMVVNNAIIILDYATREENAHLPPADRMRKACKLRFRLMIMANLTTVVAMIPLSLGLGFAGEIFRPLAVVQIGGVTAAATLSLLVIPAVYTLVENLRAGPDAPWLREEAAEQ